MQNVWQIAAGDFGRDYSHLFVDHDVMFLGPGRHGAYTSDAYRAVTSSSLETGSKVGMVKSFATEVQPGDIVLLRRSYLVTALGVVTEDPYEHSSTFDDVFGWDLQHTRRVVWQDHLKEPLSALQRETHLFASRKQIPTFTRVRDATVLAPLAELLEQCQTRPLRVLPPQVPNPLSLEELGQELFARGLANSSVDHVLRAIERQRRLLAWYRDYGQRSCRPDEHEVVAHMVLPLLLALGWSEQLLAVEWHKVDLAGFGGTPTLPENCVMVCEAKGLWHGLHGVLQQAEDYVTNLKLGHCKKILLTQGGRFYLFHRTSDGSWPERPTGYLNVERIRTRHVAPANTDGVATLMQMTPGL